MSTFSRTWGSAPRHLILELSTRLEAACAADRTIAHDEPARAVVHHALSALAGRQHLVSSSTMF